MKSKKSSGASQSGGSWKKVALTAASSLAIIDSVLSPTFASSNTIIYGWDSKGGPWVLEDVSYPTRPHYSMHVSDYVDPRTSYDMRAANSILPDGTPHSGIVDIDTHYCMEAYGYILPDGRIHNGLVPGDWYRLPRSERIKIPPPEAPDRAKQFGGHIPWPSETKDYPLPSSLIEADRQAREKALERRAHNRTVSEQRKEKRNNNPYYQVTQYLNDNNIFFRTNRGCYFGGDTLGAYIYLNDGRIFRYIDPDRIKGILQQQEEGKGPGYKQTLLQRYLDSCTAYEQSIGGVSRVITPTTPLEGLLN